MGGSKIKKQSITGGRKRINKPKKITKRSNKKTASQKSTKNQITDVTIPIVDAAPEIDYQNKPSKTWLPPKMPTTNQELSPTDEEKRKLLMYVAVASVMIVIVVCWTYFFKLNLRHPLTAQDIEEQKRWQETKEQLDQSMAGVKENISVISELVGKIKNPTESLDTNTNVNINIPAADIERIKQSLLTQATKDWLVYQNTDYKFSTKYPTNWQIKAESTKKITQVTFTSPNQEQPDQVVLTIQADIPLPATIENIEDYNLAGVDGKLYRDTSAKDGVTTDQIIVPLPDSSLSLSLMGNSDILEQMLFNFQFENAE
ncbi:MAG: hypothetical protein WC480_04990 [Patescibacteria group bacterium]